MKKTRQLILSFLSALAISGFLPALTPAQDNALEYTLDAQGPSVEMPKIFHPHVDLSGRGINPSRGWPQTLAGQEAIDSWGRNVGFSGIYRIQFNLWEISQLANEPQLQKDLLGNYERIFRRITDAGGIVLLDIFSTPKGLGKVLDKKSSPVDPKAFKSLIKDYIRQFSCLKRYNIWYEVWSAPDLDDFFLGRKQEYLNLYRSVSEAAKELQVENRIYIPVGGPSTSWWFQNTNGNSILTPERSLIYELIKFCSRYNLPLDFISWHAYSTDPRSEREITVYGKNSIGLMRDWLQYFGLNKNIPFIIDEWTYDSGANMLPERSERAYISASYIPGRIKNMHLAGVDYQLFFSLEDFQYQQEGVVRNVGVFWYDKDSSSYKGGAKSLLNVFRMLKMMQGNLLNSCLKFEDEFTGVISSVSPDQVSALIYNYIDPDIGRNFISRSISQLKPADRKQLLSLISSDKFSKFLSHQASLESMGIRRNSARTMLIKARDLSDRAIKFSSSPRQLRVNLKNLKGGPYILQRFSVDSSCNIDCRFEPVEEKAIEGDGVQELMLTPYSVNLLVIKKKPKEEAAEKPAVPSAPSVAPSAQGQEPAEEQKTEQPSREEKSGSPKQPARQEPKTEQPLHEEKNIPAKQPVKQEQKAEQPPVPEQDEKAASSKQGNSTEKPLVPEQKQP